MAKRQPAHTPSIMFVLEVHMMYSLQVTCIYKCFHLVASMVTTSAC